MRVFTRHSILRKSISDRKSIYEQHFKISKNNKYWCGIFRGRYGIKLVLPQLGFSMLHRAFGYNEDHQTRCCHMRHHASAHND